MISLAIGIPRGGIQQGQVYQNGRRLSNRGGPKSGRLAGQERFPHPSAAVLVKTWKEECIVNDQERIAQLEKKIADLEARLPAHSTPPAMLIELEEMEEELEALRAGVRRGQG